ncbi:MAG: hypothetical protein AAGN46_01215 [Acidobacteriota bacterium]
MRRLITLAVVLALATGCSGQWRTPITSLRSLEVQSGPDLIFAGQAPVRQVDIGVVEIDAIQMGGVYGQARGQRIVVRCIGLEDSAECAELATPGQQIAALGEMRGRVFVPRSTWTLQTPAPLASVLASHQAPAASSAPAVSETDLDRLKIKILELLQQLDREIP